MILFYLSLFLLATSALFSLYKQFQMLQQNSYFPSRYSKWLTNTYVLPLTATCFIFCVFSFLFTKNAYLVLFIISALVFAIRLLIAIKLFKKSIKPLVFTKRIWRLYAAAVIVLGVLFVFAANTEQEAMRICFTIFVCLCTVTSLLCYICWLLTFPVEKLFFAYYINNAKKILKNSPDIKVIGVTGSYGKTTTKFILNRILSENFNTVCTPASFNTPLGVVKTIREKIEPKTQIFICEMGAKNIGDIKEICDIVNPRYGIITSVGPQHLETFKTVDNVYKTKFELADSVLKNGGICFANLQSDDIKNRKDQKDGVLYFGEGTDFFLKDVKTGPFGSDFTLCLCGEEIAAHTKLLGQHSLLDILGAAAISYKLGVKKEDIAFAISRLVPTEHRLQLKPFIGGSLLIDDAYNANPDGSLEAVRILGSFDGYNKTVITPGLVELGEREYEFNRKLGEHLTRYADTIILVGKNRAKPMLDAIKQTDFDKSRLFVVGSFKEGLEIYKKSAGKESILLIENDLPDNYLN